MKTSRIWFSVVEWPPEYDCNNSIEISHFSSKEVCETALKEYLEDIFELNCENLTVAMEEAVRRGFTVWYTTAKVRSK